MRRRRTACFWARCEPAAVVRDDADRLDNDIAVRLFGHIQLELGVGVRHFECPQHHVSCYSEPLGGCSYGFATRRTPRSAKQMWDPSLWGLRLLHRHFLH